MAGRITRGGVLVAVVASILLSHTGAAAQTQGKFAAGAALGVKQPFNAQSHGTIGPSLIWRLGQAKEGWNYKYGLSWFSTRLDRPIGDGSSEIGKLNIRPLLLGYGYTHILNRRTSISSSLLGGYAFTSFALNDSAVDRFRPLFGDGPLEGDAANTFVLKPEVSAWINLSEKIGLNINTGYMVARPQITLRTPDEQDKRRVNADMLMLKVGLVYSIF